jgi:hypothetical protein
MKEWRCKICGAWISMAWLRHLHVQPREQALEELQAARERGEMPDVVIGDIVADTWTPKHATRDAPVEEPGT